MKSGVYVHIPFCEQRCYYCAFTVAVSGEDTYQPYMQRLIREITLSEFVEPPETIFFGGGTPSVVDANSIANIISVFPRGAVEISLEANPGTLTEAKLETYGCAGVNRINVGAQSFNNDDLKNAGRLHSADDVLRDLTLLRKHSFTNLGVDLIAGLPNQKFDVWKENLNHIIRLLPEHVSIYMLDEEERSAWGRGRAQTPSDDVFATFYIYAAERLADAGYIHYEISNWARPGFECKHNLKYWTGAPYRGFGVSAHSFSKPRRFWNTVSLAQYADLIDEGRLPIVGQEILTRGMQLEEAFLIGLRQTCGFDVWKIAEELAVTYPTRWFDTVGDLEDAGVIQFDGRFLKLTPAGWLVANGVTEELLWPNLLSTSEATL